MKPSPRFLPIVLLLCAALFPLALNVRADAELKGSPGELEKYLSGLPSTVSLVGESEVKVPADKAEVTVKISTENKFLNEALRLNEDVRSRVAGFLQEKGLPANQIVGAKFSSTQKYGIFSEKAKSHRVDNFLRIVVKDEKEFQSVAAAVDRWPEVQFLRIEVQQSNKDAMKTRALTEALEKAAERRKVFEDRLGVKLTPKSFVDQAPHRSVILPPVGDGVAPSSMRSLDRTTSIPSADFESHGEVGGSPFGEITFVGRVAVEYTVGPK